MGIQLLDNILVNKIAAGEVIERPASVVKELVENAIDASSTRIAVSVMEGGIRRIEVEDDGAGIADLEVELAFKRHATSKIRLEEDLIEIQTMGFRGEALPSIASISRMELFTRKTGNAGVRAIIEAGQTLQFETFATAPGTKVIVKDIFFNTPVRRKFLKTPVSENNHIYDIVSKLALSRPDISFSFSNEKRLYFKTPGNGSLMDTVIAIYGSDFASHFHPLDWQGEKVSIKGLVSRPEFKRINRKNQIFFVNQRVVKSPVLSRAVDEGYRGLLLAREYPALILYLQVDGHEVDINVHPQKTEVRFREEGSLFKIVKQAVRSTLEKENYHMGLEGANEHAARTSFLATPVTHSYQSTFSETREPQVYEQSISFPSQNNSGWEGLARDTEATDHWSARLTQDTETADHWSSNVKPVNERSLFRLIGQCFDAYILIEKEGALWLVDQHAAHERILFNRLRKQSAKMGEETQLLAFPLAFDLPSAQMETLEANLNLFSQIGMLIEMLGPNAAVIRSAPARLKGQEMETVVELLDFLEEGRPADFLHKALATMACKQAIKAGNTLSMREMEHLISELLETQDYKNCPHGRPTLMEISHEEMDKRFKR